MTAPANAGPQLLPSPVLDPALPSLRVWRGLSAVLPATGFLLASSELPQVPRAAPVMAVLIFIAAHLALHWSLDVAAVRGSFLGQRTVLPATGSVLVPTAALLTARWAAPGSDNVTIGIGAVCGAATAIVPVLWMTRRWAASHLHPDFDREPQRVLHAVVAGAGSSVVMLVFALQLPAALGAWVAAFALVALGQMPLTGWWWRRLARRQRAEPLPPPDPQLRKILALWREGRPAAALARLEARQRTVSQRLLDDQDVLAYRLLAWIHDQLGEPDTAAVVLMRAIGHAQDLLDPELLQARLRAETALYQVRAGRIEDAVHQAQLARFCFIERDSELDRVRADLTLARILSAPENPRRRCRLAAALLEHAARRLAPTAAEEAQWLMSEIQFEIARLELEHKAAVRPTRLAAIVERLDASLAAARQAGGDVLWTALVESQRARALELDGDRDRAIESLTGCVEIVERVRRHGLVEPSSRSALLDRFLQVYRDLIEMCVAAGDERRRRQAMELMERARCRNLLDQMYGIWSSSEATSAALRSSYRELLRRFESIDDEWLQRAGASQRSSYQRQDLQHRLDRVVAQIADERSATARQLAEPLTWPQLRQLVGDEAGEIWQFFTAPRGLYVAVLAACAGAPEIYVFPQLGEARLARQLDRLWFEPQGRYRQAWASRAVAECQPRPAASERQQKQLLQAREDAEVEAREWAAAMDEALGWLGRELFTKADRDGRRLAERLVHLPRLTLVPHGLLHALPLHALHDGAPVGPGRHYFLDLADLRYVPSLSVLAASRGRRRAPLQHFLGVEYLQGLPRASEAATASDLFAESEVLADAAATREAVLERLPAVDVLLFACHGSFDERRPIDSALELPDGPLSLRDLLIAAADRLPPLVILSACHSGRVRHDRTDEYLGLPAAFLIGGTRVVVGSLWAVEDRVARFVVHRGLELMAEEGLACAQAFMRAGRELRRHGETTGAAVPRELRVGGSRGRPSLAHPATWAAFCTVGDGGCRVASCS